MTSAFLFQIQSALIVLLISFGVYKRRKRQVHVKVMGISIIWDILLILQIELNRGAIAKASQAIHNTMWLNIHVSIAVTTVFLYFGMIYTGRRLLKGDNLIRPMHKKLGWTTYGMRILTLITSFVAVAA